MAGALVDPVDAGLLIFRNCTKEVGATGFGTRRTANCMTRVYGRGVGAVVVLMKCHQNSWTGGGDDCSGRPLHHGWTGDRMVSEWGSDREQASGVSRIAVLG